MRWNSLTRNPLGTQPTPPPRPTISRGKRVSTGLKTRNPCLSPSRPKSMDHETSRVSGQTNQPRSKHYSDASSGTAKSATAQATEVATSETHLHSRTMLHLRVETHLSSPFPSVPPLHQSPSLTGIRIPASLTLAVLSVRSAGYPLAKSHIFLFHFHFVIPLLYPLSLDIFRATTCIRFPV